MPEIQCQRVRKFRDGSELVVDFAEADVATNREYLELLEPLQRACGVNEETRTVSPGAPLDIRNLYRAEEP